ncbi:hypothetical protein D9M71_448140 [compost metagenome]
MLLVVGEGCANGVTAGLFVTTAQHRAVAVQASGHATGGGDVPARPDAGPRRSEANGALPGIAGSAACFFVAIGEALPLAAIEELFSGGDLVQVAVGNLSGQRGGAPDRVRTEQCNGIDQAMPGVAPSSFIGPVGNAADQCRITAMDHLRPYADPTNVLRQAEAIELGVFWIDRAVRAVGKVEADGRRALVEYTVIGPDRRPQQLRVIAGRDAPVAVLVGLVHALIDQVQFRRRREPVGPLQNEVGARQIGPAFGDAGGVPLVVVLCRHGQFIGQLQRTVNLTNRQ